MERVTLRTIPSIKTYTENITFLFAWFLLLSCFLLCLKMCLKICVERLLSVLESICHLFRLLLLSCLLVLSSLEWIHETPWFSFHSLFSSFFQISTWNLFTLGWSSPTEKVLLWVFPTQRDEYLPLLLRHALRLTCCNNFPYFSYLLFHKQTT